MGQVHLLLLLGLSFQMFSVIVGGGPSYTENLVEYSVLWEWGCEAELSEDCSRVVIDWSDVIFFFFQPLTHPPHSNLRFFSSNAVCLTMSAQCPAEWLIHRKSSSQRSTNYRYRPYPLINVRREHPLFIWGIFVVVDDIRAKFVSSQRRISLSFDVENLVLGWSFSFSSQVEFYVLCAILLRSWYAGFLFCLPFCWYCSTPHPATSWICCTDTHLETSSLL